MSNLTTEQLTELTERIRDRVSEFGPVANSMPKLTVGVVRIMVNVYAEWQRESDYLTRRDESPAPVEPPPMVSHMPVVTTGMVHIPASITRLDLEAEPATVEAETGQNGPNHYDPISTPALSPQATAALGPEHTVVTPLKPTDPDTARANLAAAVATGGVALGSRKPTSLPHSSALTKPLPSLRGRKTALPTFEELAKELRRQAMGGTMPTMTAFDVAKPANWGTAQAHIKRFNMSWEQLAQEAGLTLKRSK